MSGSNINQSDTVRLIIDQLIALTMTGPNINYTTEYMNNMLDIFQFVLSDESFRGRSNFVTSMKTFAYSLVQEAACPAANTEHLVSYSRLSFNLQALKIQSSTLANRQFVSSSNVGGEREDYVQFPAQSLSTSQTVSDQYCCCSMYPCQHNLRSMPHTVVTCKLYFWRLMYP